MAGRIVVFGATGYTGTLAAEALIAQGARPVLAARSRDKLDALASRLGGEDGPLETAVADVARPPSVRALVEKGDVLLSTVGPFVRWGEPALEAAIDAGAWYLDSTGETPFIRRVFEEFGPRARAAETGLVTAFGYDWVPGNLAAGLVLEKADERAVRVDVGYFMSGKATSPKDAMSGGTRASLMGVLLEPSYTFAGGRIVTERGAKRVRSFSIGDKSWQGVSVGSSEQYAVPRIRSGLREVNTYLGWFGPASRAMQVFSMGNSAVTKVPGVRGGLRAALSKTVKGSTGGPDAATRAKTTSVIAAEAFDAGGTLIARSDMTGPNGYTFTGDILAWGARQAAEHGMEDTGALGPVDAFGLRTLEQGCAEVGMKAS